MPAEQEFIAEQGNTRSFHDRLGRTHRVAVIGDYEKVEWARQLCLRAFSRSDFLAASKSQSCFRIKPVAKTESVDAVVGMEMGIAPENLFGIGCILYRRARLVRIIADIFTSG